MTSDIRAAVSPPSESSGKTVLGHPKGLLFLAFTEAWERFSFYGMQALLVLYLVQELLLPGHIENVAGMGAFRSAVESVTGPLSTQAFASQLFGLYAGLVYFTPVLGGLLADRSLGAKRTVMIGILLMTAGHFAMAFETTVLLALLLLVLGSGLLKGNIAAQVGYLYPTSDEARRTRGFTIFSAAINLGAVVGPIVCGLLAQVYGWHIGFGVAGVLMLVSAVTYFMGMKYFTANPRIVDKSTSSGTLTLAERKTLGLLAIILIISIFQFLAYDQLFNVGMIWVADQVNTTTSFGTLPVPWLVSLDSLAALLIVPVLIVFWRWQARHAREPDDLGKLSIGAAIMALSVGALAVGSWHAGSDPVLLVFPLIGFTLSGIGFMWTWPTLLALVSRRAPAKVSGIMMALVYMTAFFSGIGAGALAKYYEVLGASAFWTLQAAISLTGSLTLLIMGPTLKRAMDRLDSEALEA